VSRIHASLRDRMGYDAHGPGLDRNLGIDRLKVSGYPGRHSQVDLDR
jgi:hypothetical protein